MAGEHVRVRMGACQTDWRRDRKGRTTRAARRKETTMYTPPLLGRAVELHQQDMRTEVASDRRSKRAIAGTRTRGGFFHLALHVRRTERAHQRSARPRPAIA